MSNFSRHLYWSHSLFLWNETQGILPSLRVKNPIGKTMDVCLNYGFSSRRNPWGM